MPVLLKSPVPVSTGTATIKSGTMGNVIESILAEQKPGAAYFTLDNGMRTAFKFLDVEDSSQFPEIVEPWFPAFNAQVEMTPVMNSEDHISSNQVETNNR